jgi:carbamoyl-phosphate synthase large subunit
LITIADRDKDGIRRPARHFQEMEFTLVATEGTYKFLSAHGIESRQIKKIYECRPNIVYAIENGEIQLVINTPAGKLSEFDDLSIRKNATKYKIFYITTTAAATIGIKARRNTPYSVKSLQEYHSGIQ